MQLPRITLGGRTGSLSSAMVMLALSGFVASCAGSAPVVVHTPQEPELLETIEPEIVEPADPVRVENWEAFLHSSRTLDAYVSRGKRLLSEGRLDDPARLASLRAVAQARDLMNAGDAERALDKLDRALAMDARNGFAYLYLALAYHRMGRFDKAAGFITPARRYLPQDPHVLGELEGLEGSITLNRA